MYLAARRLAGDEDSRAWRALQHRSRTER